MGGGGGGGRRRKLNLADPDIVVGNSYSTMQVYNHEHFIKIGLHHKI